MIRGALLHTKSLLVQKNIHEIHPIKNWRSTPLYHVPFLITQVPTVKPCSEQHSSTPHYFFNYPHQQCLLKI